MLRFRDCGLSLALIAGGGAAAFADYEPQSTHPGTLVAKVQQLFAPKKPKPGPTVRSAPATITAPLKPEVVAEALRAEREAWLRRMDVCTELRRVAVEHGDDSMARQADELERQCTSLYYARTSALGVPRVKSPLPDTVAVMTPERPQEADNVAAAKASKLVAPTAPVPGTTTAAVREVKP